MTDSHAVAARSPSMKVEDSCRDLHPAILCPSPGIMPFSADASHPFEICSRSQDDLFPEIEYLSRPEMRCSATLRRP